MKFQDDISNMNTYIHTDKPKPICPPLFQSWGHKNAQAARLQQTTSRKVAATKSRKVAAPKSRKVAATKSSKTNLHTKNSQAATMPQLAAAAKPYACCLFAAIHCEKPFISIRVRLYIKME